MRFLLMLIISFATISLAGKDINAQQIFVVSDVYGILPDGTCHELVSGDFRELKRKNVHWDASTKTIKMYAAKNEEVAVQIAIPKSGAGFNGKMSDLVGPATITSDRATFSAMAWVNHVDLGLCPDLVIPLDGSVNGINSFDVPISFNGIPKANNKVGIMLFEIWVPENAEAGNYGGIVSVREGGTEVERLNLDLTVFDFDLPDMPTFAFELLSYGMPSENFGAKAHINDGDGLGAGAKMVPERTKKIDYQVYRLALDNRCFINSLPYSSQRGYPRYAYPIEGVGEKARIMSYKEWDDFFSPILNGEVNKFGEPPPHFLLPFNVNYPYVCESEPKNQFNFMPFEFTIATGPGQYSELREFETSYKTVAQQYINHFAEKGWTKTQFEVFNNQKTNKDRNRIPWKLDEPTEMADYMGLHYVLSVARWSFESAAQKGIQIRNRVDIGHFNCDRFQTPAGRSTTCGNSKGYNKFNADKYLRPVVDHWVINTTHAHGAQHTLREYESQNSKMIIYGTTGTTRAIGLHYGHFAGEGFLSGRLGIQGRVLFRLGLGTADPNKQEAGSYKGNTFYNGQTLGFDGGLASHRLKLWRNGVNDFDYIVMAMKVDEITTAEIVNSMTKIGFLSNNSDIKAFWFTNNVEDLVRAKAQLARIITGREIPGMQIEGFSEKFNPCGSEDQIVDYD
jgi:hypothetical protein